MESSLIWFLRLSASVNAFSLSLVARESNRLCLEILSIAITSLCFALLIESVLRSCSLCKLAAIPASFLTSASESLDFLRCTFSSSLTSFSKANASAFDNSSFNSSVLAISSSSSFSSSSSKSDIFFRGTTFPKS